MSPMCVTHVRDGATYFESVGRPFFNDWRIALSVFFALYLSHHGQHLFANLLYRSHNLFAKLFLRLRTSRAFLCVNMARIYMASRGGRRPGSGRKTDAALPPWRNSSLLKKLSKNLPRYRLVFIVGRCKDKVW